MKSWRLIIEDSPLEGSLNMARDEALLNSYLMEETPPTLRFYSWDPWCVSLGYFQKPEKEINMEQLKSQGIDLVRRPTGGRGVLHTKEITYSIIVGGKFPGLPASVVGSYKFFVQGILEGIKRLNLYPQLENGIKTNKIKASSKGSPVCFDSPSKYEICLQGRKIVGSAQMRRKGAILQHGSIKLKMLPEITTWIFKGEENKKSLERKATGIWDFNPQITVGECIDAIVKGFQSALLINLKNGSYTANEKKLIKELYYEKYGDREWNLEKKRRSTYK